MSRRTSTSRSVRPSVDSRRAGVGCRRPGRLGRNLETGLAREAVDLAEERSSPEPRRRSREPSPGTSRASAAPLGRAGSRRPAGNARRPPGMAVRSLRHARRRPAQPASASRSVDPSRLRPAQLSTRRSRDGSIAGRGHRRARHAEDRRRSARPPRRSPRPARASSAPVVASRAGPGRDIASTRSPVAASCASAGSGSPPAARAKPLGDVPPGRRSRARGSRPARRAAASSAPDRSVPPAAVSASRAEQGLSSHRGISAERVEPAALDRRRMPDAPIGAASSPVARNASASSHDPSAMAAFAAIARSSPPYVRSTPSIRARSQPGDATVERLARYGRRDRAGWRGSWRRARSPPHRRAPRRWRAPARTRPRPRRPGR